jgi:hypothetical protein
MVILSRVLTHPYICLFLLLVTSALLVYRLERRRKLEAAAIEELEALYALRDIRDRPVSRT